MQAISADDSVEARTREIVAGHAGRKGPLLPILHDLQHEFGHVPEEALRAVADELNLSRAELHGVASFYHDFRAQPAGKHVLKICRAEACQASGGDAISEAAAGKLGIAMGETTHDGHITLEAVYCLGLCACGPAAMIDGKVVGRIDETRLDKLIAECRQ